MKSKKALVKSEVLKSQACNGSVVTVYSFHQIRGMWLSCYVIQQNAIIIKSRGHRARFCTKEMTFLVTS